MKRVLALLLISCAVAAAQRLPGNAVPTHYALHIDPNIAAKTFSGEETIDITLAAPSKTVTLNALELTISSATATFGDYKPQQQSAAIAFDAIKQQATFSFSQPLPAGSVSLHVAFNGTLNDKLRGFYLSHSKTRSYAVTQFESTEARRAFPCFDEPALKATFDISITTDKDDIAISNTNEISDNRDGDKRTFVFATTPKMSTYLVAFLVGDFKCEKGRSDGTPVRVCATPDKVKLTKFALKTAEDALHYYNGYFGIPYPMPKLDLIALPDFEEGAMENFGAITFRETGLLTEETSSQSTRKQISYVVTHEMAHQWFGDMVTMRWWDDLWLNEGFATWMEAKATAHLHPDWGVSEDDATNLDEAMTQDARHSTRPIRARAETPEEITQMFDDITYAKAGAVIGMIENWLGDDAFRRGVHAYLAAHLYANATAEDFWNTQQQTSGQPVARVMSSFIDAPGVPLVTVRAVSNGAVPVEVSRFAADASAAAGTSVTVCAGCPAIGGWEVPVAQRKGAAQQSDVVPQGAEAQVVTASAPLFLNANDKGYFRTAYTPQQTAALVSAAEAKLTAPERIGFVGDMWAEVAAGDAAIGQYLDLVLALRYDTNASVEDIALGKLRVVADTIATAPQADALHAVLREQFLPIYANLPAAAKSDTEQQRQYRGLLFALLGQSGDAAIIERARTETQDLFRGKNPDDDGTLDESVELTAKDGTPEFWEFLSRVALNAKDPNLQEEALHLLSRFEDAALVTRTLEFATSGQVRNQDSWIPIAEELSEPRNRNEAWTWVKANWSKVQPQLTESSGAQVVAATGSFCSAVLREDAGAFFKTHPVAAADRAEVQAQERSADCIRTREVQQPRLAEWLAAHAAR